MKYDTNKNPVEVAGSITNYSFKKIGLEVVRDVDKTEINEQEDYTFDISSSHNNLPDLGTVIGQFLLVILISILFISVMSLIAEALVI